MAAGLTHSSVARYLDFSMNVCELQSRKKRLQYSQKRKKKHFKEENIIFLLFIKGRFSREESSANMTAVGVHQTHRPTSCNQCINFWDSLFFCFFFVFFFPFLKISVNLFLNFKNISTITGIILISFFTRPRDSSAARLHFLLNVLFTFFQQEHN